jgi:maleate isomerase
MEAGLEGEGRVLDAMRSASSACVGTTATAALSAMRSLELQRIALFSPYVQSTHDHEVAFLEEAGIRVVGGRCLGLSGGDEYITVPPEVWFQMACSETLPDAEGVFLSCTNIHSPEVVAPLEDALARPALTSNQAVLWYALRACGLSDVVANLGTLFHNVTWVPQREVVWR